jgi:hypothetical protein
MVIIRMLRKVRGIDFLNMFFSQKNSFQLKVFNFVFCLKRVAAAKDDCSGKGLDLAGNLRILNFVPPILGHLK